MFKPSIYECELTAYSSCCQARKHERKRETGRMKPDYWLIGCMKANWKITEIVKYFASYFFLLITGDPLSYTFSEQLFLNIFISPFSKEQSRLSLCL